VCHTPRLLGVVIFAEILAQNNHEIGSEIQDLNQACAVLEVEPS
jgi:hypothetical protein